MRNLIWALSAALAFAATSSAQAERPAGAGSEALHLCVTPVTYQSGASSGPMTSQLVSALSKQPLDKKNNSGSIQPHAVRSDPTDEILNAAGCLYVMAAAFTSMRQRLAAEPSYSQYERRGSSPRYQRSDGTRLELRVALWRVGREKTLWSGVISEEARPGSDRSPVTESLVQQAADRIAAALHKHNR